MGDSNKSAVAQAADRRGACGRNGYLDREGFEILAISGEHAVREGLLAGTHKDPFGRVLIAQAQVEGILIVSNEVVFYSYGAMPLT